VDEGKQLDSMTLQQYLDMYKQPMSEESIEAITKLSEVIVEKKKKEKKKKNPKSETQNSVTQGAKMAKKQARVVSAPTNEDMEVISC
jgi:uridine kinase